MAKNRAELEEEARELGLDPTEFETNRELAAAIADKTDKTGNEDATPAVVAPAKRETQEVSSQGVAVFSPGQHPKDLQLASRRAKEAEEAATAAESEARSAGVVDSVANQVPRGDKLSMADAAAHGAMIKEELRLAEVAEKPGGLKEEQDERAEAAGEAVRKEQDA